jgi:hypothetical protein
VSIATTVSHKCKYAASSKAEGPKCKVSPLACEMEIMGGNSWEQEEEEEEEEK